MPFETKHPVISFLASVPPPTLVLAWELSDSRLGLNVGGLGLVFGPGTARVTSRKFLREGSWKMLRRVWRLPRPFLKTVSACSTAVLTFSVLQGSQFGILSVFNVGREQGPQQSYIAFISADLTLAWVTFLLEDFAERGKKQPPYASATTTSSDLSPSVSWPRHLFPQ